MQKVSIERKQQHFFSMKIFCIQVYIVMQVFWFFPLKSQLRNLLKNDRYVQLLLHETRRVNGHNHICDVYDTPRWRKVAGPATGALTRVVYQLCVDSFPWNSRKNHVSFYLAQTTYRLILKFPTVKYSNAQPSNSKS